MSTIAKEKFTLSIVIPAFNEAEVLSHCQQSLSEVVKDLNADVEFIYVDDGSHDKTYEQLLDLAEADNRISVIRLSRNYGKEIAMTAGLDKACGDAVVVIDADLQDPPELIHTFIEYWQQGYDVVYGQRELREGETYIKKLTAHWFYRLMGHISRLDIPKDTGDFRLMSRRSVDALLKLREQHRFMKGLFTWVGFPQKAVKYTRQARHAGTSKWNYFQLVELAVEGITSFSTTPLKLSTYMGVATALIAFLYAIFIIIKTLLFGDPVAGYPSLMVAILFLGGIQLMAIGVLGEYIGRMFDETKNRPLYIVSEFTASDLMRAEKS